MKQSRYDQDNIREISSMEELRYHKMRLELSTDFLSEKLEDNVEDIKRQLSPKYLFRTIVTSVVSLVGRRQHAKHDENETEDNGPNTANVLLDGFVALAKALFRAG